MLTFRKTTFRNFFSFGNRDVVVELDKFRTTLLSGDSGSGKSSLIVEPLTFGLFGQPFRKIKKGDVVNTVNGKDCYVEVEFEIGNDTYKVIRGLKPAIFEIYKNGTMVNQNPTVRDYQKYLEEHILKMSYKVWCSIVVLGFANHTPFMLLSASERRQVVDEVLGIEVFQRMYVASGETVRELKTDIQNIGTAIDGLKDTISVQKKNFAEIQKQEKEKEDDIKHEIEKLNDLIAQLNSKNEQSEADIAEMRSQVQLLDSMKKKHEEIKRVLTNLKFKRTQLDQAVSFFESNNHCPTCQQEITDEYKNSMTETNKKKVVEVSDGVEALTNKAELLFADIEKLVAVNGKISKVETDIAVNNKSINLYLKTITQKNEELSKLVSMDGSIAKSIAKSIVEMSNKIQEQNDKKTQLNDEMRHVTMVQGLLKEDGIKGKLVAMYLPLLTKLVNDYLEEMSFQMRIDFDDNFNETIYARFRDRLTFQQLSQGEQSRVNLAIILAWRSLAEMRNSVKSSVLILDELLDAAISASDTEVLMNLIMKINGDQNIFIISHQKESVVAYCDNVISVEKVGNFSQIS